MADMSLKEIEDMATWAESISENNPAYMGFEVEAHDLGRFASALRQLLKEREWRSLDTAPLDGTVVDLWVRLKPGKFEKRVPECSWGWIRKWNGDEYQGWIGLGHMHEERVPLAWRPLPHSPDTKQGE